MLRRIVLFLVLAVVGLAPAASARGGDPGGVDVIIVSGSLEGRLIDFVIGEIESSDAQVVVLQIDSAATLGGDIERLLTLVADPPVPVAVWAGPDPAILGGGALRLLAAAPIRGAAPGVELGPASPTRAGGADDSADVAAAHPDLPAGTISGRVVVENDMDGFLDLVEPSIGQFVVGLDGREATIGETKIVLVTARTEVEGGVVAVKPAVEVTFIEPGIIDRTIRLGAGPEAAFFFLVAGLSLVVFEFYAAGPGVAAAVAVVALLVGGYGLAVLPVRWWAVALVPVGLAFYTIDFQRNDLGWRSILGTVSLTVGGLFFVDAAPQIVVSWWIVALIVFGTALWFGFALTTIVRARFSTQTIGRDHLVGRTGRAESPIEPDGTVVVDGARWRARASRVSGIRQGDVVDVVAVDGVVLVVNPVDD